MRPSQPGYGIDYIEWALDRPDSVQYDFAASDLASDATDGDAVAAAALDEGVRVAPGRFFGDPSRFRLSLSRDPSQTAEGLDILREALASLR